MDETGITGFDPDAVHTKYLAERDKRLVAGRADIRDLRTDERFAHFRDDPFAPRTDRSPVTDEPDVVILGGGIAAAHDRNRIQYKLSRPQPSRDSPRRARAVAQADEPERVARAVPAA